MNKLTQEQLEKYRLTIALKDINEQGQETLLNSSILVVGIGGLGSTSLILLSSMGIGHIGIIDNDVVSLSNLPRQIIYEYKDIGKAKVDVAKKKMKRMNPDIKVISYKYRLDEQNAAKIIKKYDIVIDCTDNLRTKFLINDICIKLNKPFVTGGVSGFSGQVMTVVPPKTKTFKDIFADTSEQTLLSYEDELAVFPATVSLISNIVCLEAVKYLLQIKDLLTDQILVVDTKKMICKHIKII